MLTLLVYLIVLLQIFFCTKSPAYGCVIIIMTRLIIPPMARVGNVSLNTMLSVILTIACIIYYFKGYSIKRIRSIILSPFKRLILPIAILGLFGTVAYSIQVRNLLQFCITEVLPFSLFIFSIRTHKEIRLCFKAIIISYLIMGVYSLYSYAIGSNQWILAFASHFNYAGEVYATFEDAARGILNSRATGSQGSLAWGQISLIVLALILLTPPSVRFFPHYGFISPKIAKTSFLLLVIINCLLTTKRSAIVPMLLLLIGYTVIHNIINRKAIFYTFASLVIIAILFRTTPYLNQLYHANIKTALFFWDDKLANKQRIKGSNVEMRTSQFRYVNKLVANNPLTGRGYSYPQQHNKKYGGKTDALFFESVYLDTIASSGYIGCFIWMYFFFWCYKQTKGVLPGYNNLFFHGSYILSICLTGISSSLSFFLTYIALLITNKKRLQQKQRLH